MSEAEVLDVLDELLAVEQRRFAIRLVESVPFVSQEAIPESRLLVRLVDESNVHCGRLVDVMLRLGGVPGPRTGDLHTADLHYQDLDHLWPRLIGDQEKLVATYRSAAQRVASEPLASEAVERILTTYQADLDALRTVRDATAQPTG